MLGFISSLISAILVNNSSSPFASKNFAVTGIIALSAAASALMLSMSSVEVEYVERRGCVYQAIII